MSFASKRFRQWGPTLDSFWYIASLPLAIGAVTLAAQLGLKFPNVPGVLLLPLAYTAYRAASPSVSWPLRCTWPIPRYSSHCPALCSNTAAAIWCVYWSSPSWRRRWRP